MAREPLAMTAHAPVTRMRVDGMTCAHCVRAVEQAMREIPGLQSVSVDLESGLVTATGEIDAGAMRAAIVEAGYEPGG